MFTSEYVNKWPGRVHYLCFEGAKGDLTVEVPVQLVCARIQGDDTLRALKESNCQAVGVSQQGR